MNRSINLKVLLGLLLVVANSTVQAGETSSGPIVPAEVVFSSGKLSLAGTVLLPKTPGKVPGIVIIHGSGESDRSNPWTKAYAEALAKRGVAVLHPDKRGCGRSAGDWRSASLQDLADDAIAAVEHLRGLQNIDPTQVGLIGFSQGGHVLPCAASRSAHVRFAIGVSGSAVPMAEQMWDEVELAAERARLTQEQINLVREIHKRGLRFVETGRDEHWTAYETALRSAINGEMKGNAVVERFPQTRDHPALKHFQAIIHYDPITYWRSVKVPFLFVYGGNDTQIRVQKSIDRIHAELPTARFNYAVLLFGSNGHALYREDLNDFLGRWIAEGGKL